ncbi:conserved Plasmodium protein, unknown function [Plasmodium gallinaceum]|uniref:Telomere length regulation protein conserved domain-containing protein n=1 Tax=Plasmodium gallinaceum TaxID=5849 RepID=A0A1J1GVN7_PLAGA|nr:conserved Plasmodium protein, unknown function [Plasmodium gallinaceum]CRG96618.1 conserved Plasmodium protein, unknown function [Plasmodium gallinaceum]
MDICLEDVLRSEECNNLEKILKKFFSSNIPISFEIIKLKKKKKYFEALTQLKNNKYTLINECYYILSNIISSILKGYLRIENVNKNKRYFLIYIWFVPLCEKKEKKKNSTNIMINNNLNITHEKKNVNKNFFFYGLYFSEWIIVVLNKIFRSLILQNDKIPIENWSFVIDLMKFIFVDKHIIIKYLHNVSILHNFNCLGNISRNKESESQNKNFNDINFNNALENYYEDINKITKAYFSFPFLLFKCITKGLNCNDEKRNLYIYNHIIPKQLNEKGFYKRVVQLCAFSWFSLKDSNINYEKIINLTKKIINLNLCSSLCTTLLYKFLQCKVSFIEKNGLCKKEKKEINETNEISEVNELNKDISINKKNIKYSKYETKMNILFNLNYIIENIFYYLHIYCTENDGKIFLSCIMKKLLPFINIIENNSLLYLCLFNKNVNVILNIVINIVFLYEWNLFFLENFFNPFSKNCLPLCYALAVIDIINNLINCKSIFFISLFKNFSKKRKIIHSVSIQNEKKNYFEVINELENEFLNENDNNIDDYSIELISANFLKDMFFYILNIISDDRQEESEKVFVSIILSKLLYTFGKHIKNINKKITKNLYNFEILSKKELFIYNLTMSNINVFENITNRVQHLFKCNDEVSLYCGQIIGEYFRYYVNNQSFKKKKDTNENKENESENNDECNKLIFPNLHQPIEYLPKQILCFKVIKQKKFIYLDDLILKKNVNKFKIKEHSLRRIKLMLNIDNKEKYSDTNKTYKEEQFLEDMIYRCKKKKKETTKSHKIKHEYKEGEDEYEENEDEYKEDEDKYEENEDECKEGEDEEDWYEEDGDEEDEDEEDGDEEDEDEEDWEKEDGDEEDGNEEDGNEEDGNEEDGIEEDRNEEDGIEEDRNEEDGDKEVLDEEDRNGDENKNEIGFEESIYYKNKSDKREFEDKFENYKDEEKIYKYENDTKDGNNIILNKCDIYKKKKMLKRNLMMQNAINIIENDLYDLQEKKFLLKLEKENEYYLNIDINKNIYIDPSEDLFECLNRLKEKANYIERYDDDINNDVLKLNEKKENYEEETFRICQTIIFLPRLIKKCDILSYIGSNIYEVLLSLNNLSIINKGKDYFLTYKLFDMVLLCINLPLDISKFVFNNIYSNFYSNIQKMFMLLSLQYTALYLSNNIKLNEIFMNIKNLMKSVSFSKSIMKNKRFLNEELDLKDFSEKYYNEFEKFSNKKYLNKNIDKILVKNNHYESENKNIINSEYHLNNKIKLNDNNIIYNIEEQNNSVTSQENLSDDLLKSESSLEKYETNEIVENKYIYNKKKKHSENMKTVHHKKCNKKKKINYFLKVCDFFFSSVYTKLFCLNIKKEVTNIDYDEYKIKKFYSSDSSLILFLISSYTLFFNCSSNSYLHIDDILVDGLNIGSFFIQNKNFLVRRITYKLLFHLINFIFKKKKFYILENENYINIMNYISSKIYMEKDFLSLQYMRELLHYHKIIK